MTATTPTSADEPLGRRELNKARTREAIVESLRALVEQQPIHKVTVDQLAERAGISRRTFFNYYPGIAAVLSEIIGENTEHMAAMIDDLNGEESPFARLRTLVQTVGIPRELIEWLALINRHDDAGEPAAMAFERIVWAEKGAWLEASLIAKLPDGVDELYVGTLASTIMNNFAAATRSWAARRAPGPVLDQDAIGDFNTELDRALAFAEQGWASPAGTVARD